MIATIAADDNAGVGTKGRIVNFPAKPWFERKIQPKTTLTQTWYRGKEGSVLSNPQEVMPTIIYARILLKFRRSLGLFKHGAARDCDPTDFGNPELETKVFSLRQDGSTRIEGFLAARKIRQRSMAGTVRLS